MVKLEYIDYFFDFNRNGLQPPGFNFQCPNGPNTWWKFEKEPPGDFVAQYQWFDLTFTNAFSTVTVPLTTHTSETAGALIAGGPPIQAFMEVIPRCTLVECPPIPNVGGRTGLPVVNWSTIPAPGVPFLIDVLDHVSQLTIETPPTLPEGAVMQFHVKLREVGSGRILADETKRFALDTRPPVINHFELVQDSSGLVVKARVQDQAASIDYVELLLFRDANQNPQRIPLQWQDGDFLSPTSMRTTFAALKPGETMVKIRVVDEAGNSSETQPHAVQVPLDINIRPGSFPNNINSRSQGKISVAILSTPYFDAAKEVNKKSLTFGATGGEDSLAFCHPSPEDVNDDKLLDQVCLFNTSATGFRKGDTLGVLRGQTVEGSRIEGSDSVRVPH